MTESNQTAEEVVEEIIDDLKKGNVPPEGIELTPEVAEKIEEITDKDEANSKVMFKSLNDLRKNGRKPEQVVYHWDKLRKAAQTEIEFGMRYLGKSFGQIEMPVRVSDWSFTKKNKIRLIPHDRKSPMGIIIKDDLDLDRAHSPYACARFLAIEILMYASTRLPEMVSEEGVVSEEASEA